jgi:hypothetical protein
LPCDYVYVKECEVQIQELSMVSPEQTLRESLMIMPLLKALMADFEMNV